MQNLVIKIVKALSKIEQEKGPFIVKCLVARNPDDIQWDLVLAANWFDEDRIQRLNYLSKKVLSDFDSDTISQFSAIIAISPDSQLAQFLRKIQHVGFRSLANSNICSKEKSWTSYRQSNLRAAWEN